MYSRMNSPKASISTFYSEIFFCEVRIGGAAGAGSDGVHHDHIAAVKQRVWIVGNVVGRSGHEAVGLQHNSLRSERAQVQPDGGAAGTAVEGYGDGAPRGVL